MKNMVISKMETTTQENEDLEGYPVNDELKPCPFCGGQAALKFYDTGAEIECELCRVRMGAYRSGTRDMNILLAIKRWNRRVEK